MASKQGKAKRKKLFGARFTSMVSVALVLFVLGLMALGGLTAARLSEVLRERFTITIIASDAAPDDFAPSLAKRLAQAPFAAHVAYISPDSAAAIVTRELGEDPTEFLGYNPLRPSVELQLKASYAERDSIQAIVGGLQQGDHGNIEHIDYNATLIDVVNSNLRRMAIALGILVVMLLLISFSLIGNTVRLALHAERFLINTMRLVGATGWFIRRPFVVSNMVGGFIAALLAIAAIAALLAYATSRASMAMLAELVLQPVPLAVLAGALIAVGMLIPFVAAWHTTDRYLRTSVDELYLM